VSNRAVSPGCGQGRKDLFLAAGVALGLHVLLFVTIPVALILAPAQAGQSPGVTSLEIALSAPAPAAAPQPVPVADPAPVPAPAPAPVPEEPAVEPAVEPEPELAPEPLPLALPVPPSPRPDPEPGTRNQEPSIPDAGARAAAWSRHNIRYPESALREGRTGGVTVRVEVLASGRAGRVELAESSGHADLDEAAVNGLRTAWYLPATDGRKAVTATQLFRARFEIVNGRATVR